MVTVSNKAIASICLVTLFAIPLFGEVFAQEDNMAEVLAEEEVDENGRLLADTSETAVSEADEKELWYKSERIFGKIDVGDFVVGPGREEIELRPGESTVLEITVTNRISDDRMFNLEVEDITGSADGSSSVSLTGERKGPYSIADYISFPEESFVLGLGERARIPVTITVPPNADPGGYYGSVLVSTVRDPGSSDSAAPRSPIIARVGSLVFLTVAGDIERVGQTLEVSTIGGKWWYESGPVDMGVLYENKGSVHLNPYGEISIKNMFGEEVGFVELKPWFVLPSSLRVREVTWDREFLLGRYTVTARINRGYDNVIDEVTTSFWVLPWKVVGATFVVLFIVIFSIRAFFRTFEFKKKT